MGCICSSSYLSEQHRNHSIACDEYNERQRRTEFRERKAWETQDHQCTGSGYAHKAHGKCTGWATDRT